MTPLAEKLPSRIRANGPITVADYMAACLGDPEHGYYCQPRALRPRRRFHHRAGSQPDVRRTDRRLERRSPGRRWARPSPFVLAELGPGRGTLMADLLRAAARPPGLRRGGAGPPGRDQPAAPRGTAGETLTASLASTATWHERIDDLPTGPLIVIANEFFDALPIRQFVRTAQGLGRAHGRCSTTWRRLAFGLRPMAMPVYDDPLGAATLSASSSAKADDPDLWAATSSRMSLPIVSGPPVKPEDDNAEAAKVLETSPAATAIVGTLAARIARYGGAALFIDYGYEGPAAGDTLQAVRRHAMTIRSPRRARPTSPPMSISPPSPAPRTVPAAVARRLTTQGAFLTRLGSSSGPRASARQGRGDEGVATVGGRPALRAGRRWATSSRFSPSPQPGLALARLRRRCFRQRREESGGC